MTKVPRRLSRLGVSEDDWRGYKVLEDDSLDYLDRQLAAEIRRERWIKRGIGLACVVAVGALIYFGLGYIDFLYLRNR